MDTPYNRQAQSARSTAAAAVRGLALLFCVLLALTDLEAWEGHNWDRWREVTTWQKPDLKTDQSGKRELAPLLDRRAENSDTASSLHPLVGSRQPTPHDRAESLDMVSALRRWKERRAGFESAIRQVLGTPSSLERMPVEAREADVDDLGEYTRRRVMIRSEPNDWIPAYLLVPKRLSAARMPAMLCLHQTVAQGKAEPCGIKGDPELALAAELVRRGYVCIAPDAVGFGDRIPPGAQPYHDTLAFFRKHPNWSFMGKMVWDVSRIIDYLDTLPFVDSNRIGSIGHSHGAYWTLFATAFEPRIQVAIASCGFTTFRSDPSPNRWSHLTALIPQLGFYLPDVANIPFDWQHVLAMAAPRSLFLWYTTNDSVFPHTDNLHGLLRDVQKVYRLHDAEGRLAWQCSDGGHGFPKIRREAAYDWLDNVLASIPAQGSAPASSAASATKTASAFYPGWLVGRAQANIRDYPWAAGIRDSLRAAARPWMDMSDDALWDLMFGNTIRRAWQVWSDGYCPACKKPVPMYEWVADALGHPWKMRCPHCRELFPKNDFLEFYRSGLNAQRVFEPNLADRSLLFNGEHPDPSDPLHKFGVDDGEGYVENGMRWRFIGAYLIFGQWKQAIVGGIRNLSAAYVATGDIACAHKAAVLLDRVADLYPAFDFGKEGVMYEGPPRAGYVSTWHDACVEVRDLALAYDAVFDGIAGDRQLVDFLAAKSVRHGLGNPKSSIAEIRRNIEERILRETLEHRAKIESNYPSTDETIAIIQTVLGWPANRDEVTAMLDAIIDKSTAVDGLTGEKGMAGYSVIGPHGVAELLGLYARANPHFVRDAVRRHPRLHDMYRFHLDTLCLDQYYPRTGDTGSFAERTSGYVGVHFTKNPGINPSSFTFLWDMYEATGNVDFVRLLYRANGGRVDGLPFDLFAPAPAGFQTGVAEVIGEHGADIEVRSVNKTDWCLAILRSGKGAHARAAWLDYDSGERHGHADAMTIGLFAKGLDLLPDFGYPPVQYGGWSAPRAVWYTRTAAHNTVTVDGANTRAGKGKTTLWFDGTKFKAVRASGPHLVGAQQYERTLVLADISETDSYLVDVFRVIGGTEHTRFLHGHFGRLSAHGLPLAPEKETRFGELMRSSVQDTNTSAPWSADWVVEDKLKYLHPSAQLRLRHTELTRGAVVESAETWVSVGGFGGTAEAWIPSILVTRRAQKPPLSSAFVAVLEPFEGKSNIDSIRRVSVTDADGRARPDDDVGLEIQLANGQRDLVIVANSERRTALDRDAAGDRLLVLGEQGVQFDGELCVMRFDSAGKPLNVLFCRGNSLRAGKLVVLARDAEASLEIDLERIEMPIVAGRSEAMELIETSGVRLWPK